MAWLYKVFSWKRTNVAVHVWILGLRLRIRRGFWLRFFAIRPGKIVMTNNYGDAYAQNPRYIADELLRRDPERRIIWLTGSRKSPFISSGGIPMRCVPKKSFRALFHAVTAQVFVGHGRSLDMYRRGWRKKAGQTCIQTNGGSFGVSREPARTPEFSDEQKRLQWMDAAWSDAKRYDYIIANHAGAEPLLRQAYWNRGRLIVMGYPRNDIFFASPERLAELRERVFSAIGAPAGAKLLLYAPASRRGNLLTPYCLNFAALLREFRARFGGEWVAGVRLPAPVKKFFKNLYPGDVFGCGDYPDGHELAACADALISDVDPLLFDFLLTRRPALAYVPDLESLQRENGLWCPFTETPLAPVGDQEELHGQVRNFQAEDYQKRVDAFLAVTDSVDDGAAAKRAADLVEAALAGGASSDHVAGGSCA